MTENKSFKAKIVEKPNEVFIEPKTNYSDERAELAAQQELLLSSLLASAQVPIEVANHQLQATAWSLFQKRARYISRCLPHVTNDTTYFDTLKEYAIQHPGSHPDGVCRDAAEFKEFYRTRKETKNRPRNIWQRLQNLLNR